MSSFAGRRSCRADQAAERWRLGATSGAGMKRLHVYARRRVRERERERVETLLPNVCPLEITQIYIEMLSIQRAICRHCVACLGRLESVQNGGGGQ